MLFAKGYENQVQRISQARNHHKSRWQAEQVWFLAQLIL
jgi:hypothetical protein